ncbi:hypothetical protein Tco_0953100 [Tanacetum coccineum]|uniref:Uncharacterized protein n=1 Tax=Tanacetum coccineum TaxID=301880 RepID=A0ABQ5DYX3_9ASTR
MSKDQSIPRRNKVDWHMAKDDPTLTTMTFIPKHETVQKYDAILPDTLTNQALKESDTYKNYHDFATGKVIPKPKRMKEEATAQGLKTLSEITLSEADKIENLESPKQTRHNSKALYASGSDDDDQDEDNEQTESDNDGDDFVHPKFSTHDEEKNLYKTLVDAYESDKDILATYRDTVTLKRHRDDEEPSVGSNRGSKRRRARKEPESSSAPKEKTSKSTGKSKEGSKSYQKSTGKSAQAR